MDGSVLKPSCPGLYATTILKADYVHRDHDETIYTPAECNSLEFNVECHLATAFVTCKTQWMVPSKLLKRLWLTLDADKNGRVSVEEFAHFMRLGAPKDR